MFYLVVGVGWNCSFNLHTDKTDCVSIKVNEQQVHRAALPLCRDIESVFLLPALTLAVLDEGQFNELVFHEGSPHQLQENQNFFFLTANILSLFSTLILLTLKLCVYLHGDCVCEQGNTLHGLVSTAATTSPHRHTGWDKEVVCLPRQLPPNLHQSVPWLAAAPRVHLQPPPH